MKQVSLVILLLIGLGLTKVKAAPIRVRVDNPRHEIITKDLDIQPAGGVWLQPTANPQTIGLNKGGQ